MIEAIAVAARFIQFSGAAILFGSSAFFLYAKPLEAGRAHLFLIVSAGAVLAGAALALVAQAQIMVGSSPLAAATTFSVLTDTQFGHALAVRLLAAFAALVLAAALPAKKPLWRALTAIGAIVTASFAWTGHGAADDGLAGALHLIADILHLLAAAIWLGALAAFIGLLFQTPEPENIDATKHALERFSGIGSALVVALLASGLVNSWFLVGPRDVMTIFGSSYGVLLVTKIVLFAGMLGLAALNRFRLTPALAGAKPQAAVIGLRRSIVFESVLGAGVLLLVSALGMLAPPVSP